MVGAAGIGVSAMMLGLAYGDKANKEGNIIWGRFGIVKTLSFGVHYFPIKWVGITIELQNRFYDYKKDSGSKIIDEKESRYKKTFAFSTDNMLVIGVRTTI